MALSHELRSATRHEVGTKLAPFVAIIEAWLRPPLGTTPRILDAIRRLDTREESLAEVCRRIGDAAWELDAPRPSYVHLRRLLLEKRAREDAARERRRALMKLASDIERDLRRGRVVNAYEVAERVAEVKERWPV